MQATEDELVADEKKYKEEQAAEQEGFSMHVVDLQRSIGNLGQLTDMAQTAAYAKQMQEMEKDLKESQKQADLYNSREALFGMEPTDYHGLKKIQETFDPFLQFWSYANSWRGPLSALASSSSSSSRSSLSHLLTPGINDPTTSVPPRHCRIWSVFPTRYPTEYGGVISYAALTSGRRGRRIG